MKNIKIPEYMALGRENTVIIIKRHSCIATMGFPPSLQDIFVLPAERARHQKGSHLFRGKALFLTSFIKEKVG